MFFTRFIIALLVIKLFFCHIIDQLLLHPVLPFSIYLCTTNIVIIFPSDKPAICCLPIFTRPKTMIAYKIQNIIKKKKTYTILFSLIIENDEIN